VGELSALATDWNPSAGVGPFESCEVHVLRAHGAGLYVAGEFQHMGGQARSELADLELSTGLASSWDPSPDGSVNAIEPVGSTVYLGGFFSRGGGEVRQAGRR